MKKYKKYFGFFLIIISVFIYIFKANKNEVVTSQVTKTITTVNYFYVDVKGCVKNPGVYIVYEGQIVMDAIMLAGGFTDDYDTSNINLAAKLTYAMVINIAKTGTIKEGSSDTTDTTLGKININTASLSLLDSLPGISEKVAQNIIEYRKTKEFKTIEEIMNVSGIKNAIFEKIKDFITV